MLMGKPRRNAFGRVGTKFWRQNFCCRHVGVNDLPRGGKKNSADTLYSAKGRVVRRRRLKKWRKKCPATWRRSSRREWRRFLCWIYASDRVVHNVDVSGQRNYIRLKFFIEIVSKSDMEQGILKREVSLYRWPPVWLVWNQLHDYWQCLFLFAKQANPNQSNRRSTVQWYFPL